MSHGITNSNWTECASRIAKCYCQKLVENLSSVQMDSIRGDGALTPGDFCDDNMLMADCFVELGYVADVDSLACDDDMIAAVWNQAWREAVDANYDPANW